MKKNTFADIFATRVQKTDTCWLWTGGKNTSGYGQCSVGRGTQVAHRIVYEALVGPIPNGLTLDHLCRVRHCVNPAHMEPVTKGENTRRGKAAKTHCNRGHPLSGDNLVPLISGYRACKECARLRDLGVKIMRGRSNADKKVCKSGHEFTAARSGGKGRRCRVCANLANARYHARKTAT